MISPGVLLFTNNLQASGPLGAERAVRHHRVRVYQRVHSAGDAAATAAGGTPPAAAGFYSQRCVYAGSASYRHELYGEYAHIE